MSINDKCPCGSGQKYKKCCKTYHDGRVAASALLLMRSRYSAYALKKYNYIVKTSFKTEDLESIKEFSDNTDFQKLEIIEFINGELEAFVTFKATLFSQNQDISFCEKSRFNYIDNRWYYIDGKIYNNHRNML